jgi:hypothetical protein
MFFRFILIKEAMKFPEKTTLMMQLLTPGSVVGTPRWYTYSFYMGVP